MERRIIEKMEKVNEEELLRIVRRGKVLGIEAAKKLLLQGKFGVEGEYLREILGITKIPPKRAKEATKVKNEAAEIIIERFLNEQNFLSVLKEMESQKILKRATRKYRSQNRNIPNYVLVKIIEKVPTEREWAGRTLKNQNPSVDQLLIVLDWTEGELQIEILEELFKRKLPKREVVWLITNSPEKIVEMIWSRVCQGKRFSNDDFAEMLRYTESGEIKKEIIPILLNKKNLELPHIKEMVEAIETLEIEKEIIYRLMDLLNSWVEEISRKLKEKGEDGRNFEKLETIGDLKEKLRRKFREKIQQLNTAEELIEPILLS